MSERDRRGREEEPLAWVPKKRKLAEVGALPRPRKMRKEGPEKEEIKQKVKSKSLFDEKVEMVLNPNAAENQPLSRLEEIILEEKELLQSLEQNKDLKTVKELAHGVEYHGTMKTDWEPPRFVQEMPEAVRDRIREEFHILAEGEDVPPLVRRFKDLKLPKPMLEVLKGKGIRRPTPIQMQVCGNKTRQDKTRQNKTKQNKTKQNKTKQNKTKKLISL